MTTLEDKLKLVPTTRRKNPMEDHKLSCEMGEQSAFRKKFCKQRVSYLISTSKQFCAEYLAFVEAEQERMAQMAGPDFSWIPDSEKPVPNPWGRLFGGDEDELIFGKVSGNPIFNSKEFLSQEDTLTTEYVQRFTVCLINRGRMGAIEEFLDKFYIGPNVLKLMLQPESMRTTVGFDHYVLGRNNNLKIENKKENLEQTAVEAPGGPKTKILTGEARRAAITASIKFHMDKATELLKELD